MPIVKIKCSMGPLDNIGFRILTKWKKFFEKRNDSLKDVPIIINNYNRLEYLMLMLEWLKKAGYKNVFIIDNNSTYSPLIKYYQDCPYTVFKLDQNVGFLALWKTILFTRFSDVYYVYSDPDILPIDHCPHNAIEYFRELLDKYEEYDKVGFGLKIDDLPEHYPLKNKVINWESKFWHRKIEDNIYEAPIDTTFALYRPGIKGGSELKALRTGFPYVAHHLTWYINPANLSNDEIYYQSNVAESGSWTNKLIGKNTIPKY